MILVHGSAQGSRTGGDQHFSRQRQLAERGFQLLVPDRPGHGRSADPGRPDDAEADGALVADLIGDGAHLVGHSYGGCVALAAAVRNPSAVHSLTLIEPAMPLLAMHRLAVLRFGIRVALVTAMPMSDVSRVKRFVKLVNIPPELRGTDGADGAELSKMGRALTRTKIATGRAHMAWRAMLRLSRPSARDSVFAAPAEITRRPGSGTRRSRAHLLSLEPPAHLLSSLSTTILHSKSCRRSVDRSAAPRSFVASPARHQAPRAGRVSSPVSVDHRHVERLQAHAIARPSAPAPGPGGRASRPGAPWRRA